MIYFLYRLSSGEHKDISSGDIDPRNHACFAKPPSLHDHNAAAFGAACFGPKFSCFPNSLLILQLTCPFRVHEGNLWHIYQVEAKNEVFGMQRSGNLYLARIYILTWSKFLLGNHPNKFGASRVRLPNLFLESLDSMATFPYARPAQVLAWTKIRFPTRQNRAIPKKLLGRLLGLLWLFSFSGRRAGHQYYSPPL